MCINRNALYKRSPSTIADITAHPHLRHARFWRQNARAAVKGSLLHRAACRALMSAAPAALSSRIDTVPHRGVELKRRSPTVRPGTTHAGCLPKMLCSSLVMLLHARLMLQQHRLNCSRTVHRSANGSNCTSTKRVLCLRFRCLKSVLSLLLRDVVQKMLNWLVSVRFLAPNRPTRQL